MTRSCRWRDSNYGAAAGGGQDREVAAVIRVLLSVTPAGWFPYLVMLFVSMLLAASNV
jgi:hypothetical protein